MSNLTHAEGLSSTKVGTAFGTLLTVAVNLSQEDLLKTVVLAAVGGISSYLATLLVKWILLMAKRRRRSKCD